jgi:protoporphyrinogen/coproporphyrinogen III oxidase
LAGDLMLRNRRRGESTAPIADRRKCIAGTGEALRAARPIDTDRKTAPDARIEEGVTLRIAVGGAGIAGLSTHYFLEREARRMGITAHVETWDPRPGPGGNVRTATENGWQCEESVESILSSRRETMDLALDLGLADRIVQGSPLAKKRFIVWKGKPRSMGPASAIEAFPTWGAKLRALREPFVPRGPEDESVAEFGARRLGRGLMDQIMDPMVTGVYAAAP